MVASDRYGTFETDTMNVINLIQAQFSLSVSINKELLQLPPWVEGATQCIKLASGTRKE